MGGSAGHLLECAHGDCLPFYSPLGLWCKDGLGIVPLSPLSSLATFTELSSGTQKSGSPSPRVGPSEPPVASRFYE